MEQRLDIIVVGAAMQAAKPRWPLHDLARALV